MAEEQLDLCDVAASKELSFATCQIRVMETIKDNKKVLEEGRVLTPKRDRIGYYIADNGYKWREKFIRRNLRSRRLRARVYG